MTLVTVALLGGLVWVGLRGQADVATFLVGALLGAALALPLRLPLFRSPAKWLRSGWIASRIGLFFLVELTVANVRQLRLTLQPALRLRPRWVRFKTRLERPATRSLLGVLISLTPGTVTQELRDGEYTVHVLDADPDEDPLAVIRDRFESLLVEWEEL